MAAFSEADVRRITSFQKLEGQKTLANCLQLKLYKEDDDLRMSIYIDYLYDNVMFAFDKGFTLYQTTFTVNFAKKFLNECQGKSLTEAVRHYRFLSEELIAVLGERNFRVYTDHVFSTFMSQYKLFTFVFLYEQLECKPHVNVDIHTPDSPDPLKQGRELNLWKYEQLIENLEDEEMKKTTERIMEKEKKQMDLELRKQDYVVKYSSVECPLNKESLAHLIRDVLQTYTGKVTDTLKTNVQEVGEDLGFMLEKTSLPRPAALGVPPRYKLRTAIVVPHKSSSEKGKSRNSKNSARSNRQRSASKHKKP